MTKTSRGGRRGATGGTSATGPGSGGGGPTTFSDMTDADASKLRQDVDDKYSSDVVDAIKLYISDSNPNKDGYSHSQNMNYKLDNNADPKKAKMPLNATEQFIDQNIQAGMHRIGKDVTLTRYCHDDILKKCGVKNYQNMSESQLKKALVGVEFDTTSYTSYSYDKSKNPFRPGVLGGNGREVTMATKAKANTNIVFGAKKQAEVVVNKGTKQKITNVYFDGTMATPRGRGSMPRLVIETETI